MRLIIQNICVTREKTENCFLVLFRATLYACFLPWTHMPQDSPTVQTHCTQSAMLAEPATAKGKPNGTHRNFSVRPDSVTRIYNTNRSWPPSPGTSQPVRTLVDASLRKLQWQTKPELHQDSLSDLYSTQTAPPTPESLRNVANSMRFPTNGFTYS